LGLVKKKMHITLIFFKEFKMDERAERGQKYLDLPEQFKTLVECWPYTHVCFADFSDFTGQAMGPGRLRNLVNLGQGPKAIFNIGKKNCIDKIDAAWWLWKHTQKINKKEN